MVVKHRVRSNVIVELWRVSSKYCGKVVAGIRKSGPVPDLYLRFPVSGIRCSGTGHGMVVRGGGTRNQSRSFNGISIWNVSGLSGFGRASSNERTGIT